jgi:tetratricopeptide (TPR) repeat protein
MNRKNFIISQLKINSNDPFNHYLLALEYIKESNRSEALLIFNNLFNSTPTYLPLYYTYAINLIESENYEMAKFIIEKGIELAVINQKDKIEKELIQLLNLYFD